MLMHNPRRIARQFSDAILRRRDKIVPVSQAFCVASLALYSAHRGLHAVACSLLITV